jgi:hypothetical protein
MSKISEGFLSEDGQTYTSFVEDDRKEIIEDVDDNGDQVVKTDVDKLLDSVKIDEIPEGQRETFKQLAESVKSLRAELDSTKKESDKTAILQQLVEKIGQQTIKTETREEQRKRVADQLKFEDEEKDYYAPHLKMLASAIDKLMDNVDGIGKKFEEDKKSTFVKDVQTFIKSNKIPDPVIKKMDEIAKEFGPGAYNNLDKLYKYARVELGIKDSKPNNDTANNGGRRNVVEFGGKRRSDSVVDTKPAKTMQEAWKQAEEQLSEVD